MDNFKNILKRLNRYKLAIFDFIIIVIAYMFSKIYITDMTVFINTFDAAYMQKLCLSAIVYVGLYTLFGLYDVIWTYAKSKTFAKLCLVTAFGNIIVNIFNYFIYGINDSNYFNEYFLKINTLVYILIVVAIISIRTIIKGYNRHKDSLKYDDVHNMDVYVNRKNLLIIGAGESTGIILPELSRQKKYNIIGIIDDDPKKLGCYIHEYRVIGNRSSIKRICEEKNINEILISIPSLKLEEKDEIIDICSETGCEIKIVPQLAKGINENEKLAYSIRSIKIEDILEREPINLDNDEIEDIIKDKVVLVTGGGGSIGSELCRQIALNHPKKLIILDIYENNAYDIQNEIKENGIDFELEVVIADVRDEEHVSQIFKNNNIDYVFHAAAHKHVPLMEDEPVRAIKNNVFGTLNMVNLADKYKVRKFILVSTDKAVNPTNVMGCTKRICEMIIQSKNAVSSTEYCAVRFGNVLGSNGSVIPLFKRQIEKGGPVTITDKNIIRYFMTIPEAVSLILEATTYAKGGEIFILDMGTPVKIYDMAVKMIALAGFRPNEDIKIEITGLRPGEKMYEELLVDKNKDNDSTSNKKIFVSKPETFDFYDLCNKINNIKLDDGRNIYDVKKEMKNIVPEYNVYEGKKDV